MSKHMRSFLIGLSAGSAIGLLFAPQSGVRTRSQIGDSTNEAARQLKNCAEAAQDLVEHAKNLVARQEEGIVEGVKRGTEAYKKAVS